MTVKELIKALESVSENAVVKIVMGEDSFVDAAFLDDAYVSADKNSVVFVGSY